jgi:hypothetical protein
MACADAVDLGLRMVLAGERQDRGCTTLGAYVQTGGGGVLDQFAARRTGGAFKVDSVGLERDRFRLNRFNGAITL